MRICQRCRVTLGIEEPPLDDEAGGGGRAVVGDVEGVRELVWLHFALCDQFYQFNLRSYYSVTRLGNLLDFGQVFKAFGNN